MNNTYTIAKAIYNLSKKQDAKVLVDKVIGWLKANQKLSLLPKIVSNLKTISKKEKDAQVTQVISAFALKNKTLEEIIAKVSTNSSLEAKSTIDPSLIGGFIAIANNKIYDASLKTQLHKLKQTLVS